NAHVIIFDTNGEYKIAFQGIKEKPYKDLSLVNPFNIDKDGLKIPFWFMNYADLDYLFRPSELTQAPIFKTAIGYSKSKISKDDENSISKHYERFIISIMESDDLFMKKYHKPGNSWVLNPENEIIGLANE